MGRSLPATARLRVIIWYTGNSFAPGPDCVEPVPARVLDITVIDRHAITCEVKLPLNRSDQLPPHIDSQNARAARVNEISFR